MEIDGIIADCQAEIIRLEEMKAQLTKAQEDLRSAVQSMMILKKIEEAER